MDCMDALGNRDKLLFHAVHRVLGLLLECGGLTPLSLRRGLTRRMRPSVSVLRAGSSYQHRPVKPGRHKAASAEPKARRA